MTEPLPLLLAGPIVRRAGSDEVCFWIAVSKEIEDGQVNIVPYDDKCEILGRLVDSKSTFPVTTSFQQVRLGKNIWMILFKVQPHSDNAAQHLPREFPKDVILAYDIKITTKNGGETNAISKLVPNLGYGPDDTDLYRLPSFVIGEKNRKIIHGSCRRPGADVEDVFISLDLELDSNALNRLERPASLILTGDQIYADHVDIHLFERISKIAKEVFGYVEKIPIDGRGYPADEISYNPDKMGIRRTKLYDQKISDRKYLTARGFSRIGFSTEDGEAHLLSFAEYASMYLVVWNEKLYERYQADSTSYEDYNFYQRPKSSYEHQGLRDFHLAVKACRKVMANCSTYMIFDDHEVTDDWNLDKPWRAITSNHQTSRRIITNALAAYWCFQAWGNDPSMFEKGFHVRIGPRSFYRFQDKDFLQVVLEYLCELEKSSLIRSSKIELGEDLLLNYYWAFMTATNPKALCVDSRTRRDFPDGKSVILHGEIAWPILHSLINNSGFKKNDVMLIVLPTPLIVHPILPIAQRYEIKRHGDYAADKEGYHSNPSQIAEFLNRLHSFYPSSIVICSGDVHFSSIISGIYVYGKSKNKAGGIKSDWSIPIIQITSSPIKNLKKELFEELTPLVPKSSLGNIGESLVRWCRFELILEKKNDIGGLAEIIEQIPGDLGYSTFIYEPNICVVTMPTRNGKFEAVFIGRKHGTKKSIIKLTTNKNVILTEYRKRDALGYILPRGYDFS